MARSTARVHGNAADRCGGGKPAFGTPHSRGVASRAVPGLTLIELLVVIVIIGIMASLLVTVASKVAQGGKVTLTEDALKIADQALNSYVQEKGAIPPPLFEDPRDKDRQRLIPVADARNMTSGIEEADRVIINSVGLFIHQAEKDAGLTGLFAGVDGRILQRHDPDKSDGAYTDPSMDQMAAPPPPTSFADQPRIPTLMDGFGRPLRYVHPAFGGLIMGSNRANPTQPAVGLPMNGQDMFAEWIGSDRSYTSFSYSTIRRNDVPQNTAAGNPNPEFKADSDGGRPVGNRPYFYSAGLDADPSTLEDNVYAGGSRPEFDKK